MVDDNSLFQLYSTLENGVLTTCSLVCYYEKVYFTTLGIYHVLYTLEINNYQLLNTLANAGIIRVGIGLLEYHFPKCKRDR